MAKMGKGNVQQRIVVPFSSRCLPLSFMAGLWPHVYTFGTAAGICPAATPQIYGVKLQVTPSKAPSPGLCRQGQRVFSQPPSFPPQGCVSQEKSDCGGGFYGRGSKSLAWVQPPSAQLLHRPGLGFWAREAEGDGGLGRGLGTGGHRAAALRGTLLSSAQRWQQHGWVLLVSHPSLGLFKATDLRDPHQGRQSHREDIN